jgi:hypothetical protein
LAEGSDPLQELGGFEELLRRTGFFMVFTKKHGQTAVPYLLLRTKTDQTLEALRQQYNTLKQIAVAGFSHHCQEVVGPMKIKAMDLSLLHH